MSMKTDPDTVPAAEAWSAPWQTRVDDRTFLRAVLAAGLLHAMLFVGVWQTRPRVIGDPDGTDGPITVEIVTPGDASVAGARAEPPSPPPAPAPVEAPPSAEPPAAEASPERPVEAKPDVTPVPEKQAPPLPLQSLTDTPDLFTLPDPSRTKPDAAHQPPSEAHKDQSKKSATKTSRLDLSIPDKMATEPGAAGGFSASSMRPPDITKSPQNDEFGRGVVRALRATMPPHPGPSNRVTIRILLNEQGNVKDVRVIRHSDDAALDQSVAFSAMQASYPIPPAGSTQSDRTFLVTYIYR